MTTTKPERRYFQRISENGWVAALVSPATIAAFESDPDYREVLLAPISEIEVSEPDASGDRRAHVGDRTVGWIRDRGDVAAKGRGRRGAYLGAAGDAEAVIRWVETHPQPDPESVARVQAVRDALAALTDDERAEALR